MTSGATPVTTGSVAAVGPIACVALAAVVTACGAIPERPQLDRVFTTAQRHGYHITGRYDEVVTLCRAFSRAYAGVRCREIGQTAQGRPIVAVEIIRRANAPVILIQAGIHAGEIDGKDAGFELLRDLLEGAVAPGALDAVSVVFVPVLNPDGHERFGANHRPNQRGPEEMGFRTNATRNNLNRDYTNAQTEEVQAVLDVIRDYDPIALVDLHATDGAKFEHDIAVVVGPLAPRPDALEEAARSVSTSIQARLVEYGHLPLDFYPSFVDDTRPHAGFALGEAPARFGTYYMAARNRLGILVETHSWRPYSDRVRSTYHAIQAVLELATHEAARWREIADEADAVATVLGGTDVVLAWTNDEHSRELAFRGYAYERRVSDLTGGTWLAYDETRPEVWTVPLYDNLVPGVTVSAPRGGYIIDGGYAAKIAPILDRHGIVHVPVDAPRTLDLEVFRASKVTYSPPYEGRTRAQLEGSWTSERRALDRGGRFVPIGQAAGRLVLHLFEPSGPDSLVSWGHFNAAFERKEYIEDYVIEDEARKMIAADPRLRAEYEAAVASDPAMDSVEARRDWWYRRHPSWDERVDLVPVYRTDLDLRPPPRAARR